SGSKRYLFAIPQFKSGGTNEDDIDPPSDATLTLQGVARKPSSVRLLQSGAKLDFDEAGDGVVSVHLPAAQRTKLVDVVEVDLSPAAAAAADNNSQPAGVGAAVR